MRDVVGFEGLYKVTSCGKIWNCRTQKFLKASGGTDYQMIQLAKDDKYYFDYVHRIVAKAYIPNPHNYPQVNHKDEVRYHNWVNNLEWCTSKYNLYYSDVWQHKKKVACYCVELDKTFSTIAEAARATGVGGGNLSRLLRDKNSANRILGGYHWRVVN